MQPIDMESLCQKGYDLGDLGFHKGSFTNETLSVGWEMNFPEFGAERIISEKGSGSFILGTHNSHSCSDGGGDEVGGTLTVGLPNALSVDEELSTKFFSPFSESDCQDPTHIKIKSEGLENHRRPKSSMSFHRSSAGFSAESFSPVKRSRSACLNSQIFFCQVLGCNKDLSSSKDYHKRHRVCDGHSKTAKVIVNGIEQRFCQQCSRFQVLVEFDEGKRSCRRRLANHNERRRKPHLGNHCGRNRRFRSNNVGMFDGISIAETLSISNKTCHADPHFSGKLGANGWNQQIKAEYKGDYNELFASPRANDNLHPRDMISFGKQYPCVHGIVPNDLLKSGVNDIGDNHSNGIPELESSDCSYTFTTSGEQNIDVLCTEPNLNGLSTTASPSALSLLSSQSQKSPSFSTEIHMAQTWSLTDNHIHCSASQVSGATPKEFPLSSVNGVSHKLGAYELNPEMSDLHPINVPEDDVGVSFEDSEFFEGLTYNTDGVSCRGGLAMDLLQLSTHLQSVEREKQSTYLMPFPDICTTSRQ